LAALPTATVVTTPGNHDVPLYRFWERIIDPYGNYRRFLHPNNCRAVKAPGISLLSLDTTSPLRRIVEGRLDPGHLEMARRAFAADFVGLKAVAAHHPFAIPRGWRHGRALDPTGSALKEWASLGVELVLGGHLHWSYAIEPTNGAPWVLHVGTATTTRGRGPERGVQSAASIVVESRDFVWTVFRYEPAARRWTVYSERRLPRR
jgi:3',5'-cyclic AMP phosphodiesterase CpdA